MNKILFYLIEQQDLDAPIIKQFKTMGEIFKYITDNNLKAENVKLVSSNVYFYTPKPDDHIEIKYRNKVKRKKEKESGEE